MRDRNHRVLASMAERQEISRQLCQSLIQASIGTLLPDDIRRILTEISEQLDVIVKLEDGKLAAYGDGDITNAYLVIISRIYEDLKVKIGTRQARSFAIKALSLIHI